MEIVKHCQICENQQYDILSGYKCGLTNLKPTFTKKCSEIKFEKIYEEKIKEINIEYELVRRTKFLSYLNFAFYITLSFIIILGGYIIGKYALDKGVISTVPLTIIGIGIMFLPLASGPLNKYIQNKRVAIIKKERLDELLLMYNISYSIEVIVNKDLHGNQDIKTKLTFIRKYYR